MSAPGEMASEPCERRPSQVNRAIRADARRNREQILAAASEVFAAIGANAPLDEIAQRSGVGIATLYRRFPNRQTLQRAVALDVLARITHEARLALAEEPDAFAALARYMRRALDLRVGAVMPALARQIALDDTDILNARDESSQLVQTMIQRAQAEGSLRPDITEGDIGLLIIRLARPLPEPISLALSDRLAQRHLSLLLAGLRAPGDPGHERELSPLPDPALRLADLRGQPPE